MDIFAFYPFSKTSKPGDNVTWHIVLFDKWFDTGRYFPDKYKTSLSVCCNDLVFMRHWGKPNKKGQMWNGFIEPDYYCKVWHLPWQRWAKNTYYLKDKKWVPMEDSPKLGEFHIEWDRIEKERDKLVKTIAFMKDGHRIITKCVVTATKRLYCWWWLPKWLPIFPKVVKEINIKFDSSECEFYSTYYPFTKNLETSWNNYVYLELPKYKEKQGWK